jgi:hypothetical protein
VLYLVGLAAYFAALALMQSRLNAVWRQSLAVAHSVTEDALDTTALPAFR